jgi:pimeloyl-ACP methyl ester carboxylesterase
MNSNRLTESTSLHSSSIRRSGWRRPFGRLLGIAGGTYLLLLGLLLWNEPRLVYPGAVPREQHYATLPENTEEVWITSADGWKLHAWLLKADSPQRTILFCHGNGENVGRVGHGTARKMREQLQADVLVVDYRGFGLTGGEPNEQRVIDDCAAALKWLAQSTGKSFDQITLFGRSLGGGIAVQLAGRFGARELIIDRTFDSLASPAARKVPWIPVRWLMQNRYQSDEMMEQCHMPVFQSHFAKDELIPIECARALFARVQNPRSEFLEMPGGTHLTPLPGSYWKALRRFLDDDDR